MHQMGFYDRGLYFLCNKWFSLSLMIEDFIVFATNGFLLKDLLSLQQMVFYDRGLHCLCNKWFL